MRGVLERFARVLLPDAGYAAGLNLGSEMNSYGKSDYS